MSIIQTNKEFNRIEWLNHYFDGSPSCINEEDIKSVLYFALIWNLFELRACSKFATVASIAYKVNEVYSRGLLRLHDFTPYSDYYQNRYLIDGQVNGTFDRLNFRRNDKKELVESVLKRELDDVNNIVLALLLLTLTV
jgi:hypothetical protein